ncbi:MAG: ABC transporter substrate-binding protein [SAR324 cluster bacterium]|nr:ABC transporter substrate-binding protein [SAR324 cluster bacterium]
MKKLLLLLSSAIFLFIILKSFTPKATETISTPTPLKVGTNIWIGYEPLYLAQKLGYFQGSAIELVQFSNSTQVLHAYKTGQIQVAALTLDEVLMLQSLPDKPRVILIVDFSNGADSIVGQPEFKNLKSVSNKRIGVENTAMGGFFLSRAFATSGLNLDKITIVPLSLGEHEKAFAENRVDAVVTFDPTKSNLIKNGGVELFNSSQIPGEIIDSLVASDKITETRKKDLQRLLIGWEEAVELIHNSPEKALAVISERLKMPPTALAESYKGIQLVDLRQNIKLMSDTESNVFKTLEQLPKFLIQAKLLSGKVDTSGVLNPSVITSLNQGH